MSKWLAMTLQLTLFLAIAGQSIAQDRAPDRANRPPKVGDTAREPVIARDVVVWELRFYEGVARSLVSWTVRVASRPGRAASGW
jgi:hypothetical protein